LNSYTYFCCCQSLNLISSTHFFYFQVFPLSLKLSLFLKCEPYPLTSQIFYTHTPQFNARNNSIVCFLYCVDGFPNSVWVFIGGFFIKVFLSIANAHVQQKQETQMICSAWRAFTPCPPSHLGTWLCEGVGHGSEAAVSGKLVWNHIL
jgi:hypothetical protein